MSTMLSPTAEDAGNFLMRICHQASRDAGWWTVHGRDIVSLIRSADNPWDRYVAAALISQKLMLSVSELAEAMEGLRKGLPDDKLPHRTMLEVELADAVIRVCDLAGALGLDLGNAIQEKMAYNAKREDHKAEVRAASGGKAF
jgi:NTP pyrophosphatase (non-canonical NTP hydrolase)